MSGFEIELPSSPDPLADEDAEPTTTMVSAPVPPSTTRRVFQSSVSSRFSALSATSPRKRMFALDVGNEIAPQTIYVTVEAGADGIPIAHGAPAGANNVRRKLFTSPTPQASSPDRRRMRTTTTTTIPLRGLTDDEAEQTPKRRRRSSTRPGTPGGVSSATTTKKKKRQGTPRAKGTPKSKTTTRKARGGSMLSSDALQSETPAIAADRTSPKKRGRPPKRKSTEPSDGRGDPDLVQSVPRKRGRPRKSLGSGELAPLPSAGAESERRGVSNSPDVLNDPIIEPIVIDNGGAAESGDDDVDLWMANLSDPPAAEDQQNNGGAADGVGFSEPGEAPQSDHAPVELEDQGHLPGESDDYAPMMDYDDRSDVASHNGEEHIDVAHHTTELEDQGPLPGESDDYNPVDEHDKSDTRTGGDRGHEGVQPDSTELEDQGPLPGESDDFAPLMDHDDRSEAESHHSQRSQGSGDEADHTVDPESFTMIGIDTMPSFRRNRDAAPTSDAPEIGADTSLFINKTLDSLRQEIVESDDEADVDLLPSRGQTPAKDALPRATPASTASSARRRKTPRPKSPAKRLTRYDSSSPRRTQSVSGSVVNGEHSADGVQFPAQADSSPHVEHMETEEEADEDSFSDIPEEVLAAAESQEEWLPSKRQTAAEEEEERDWAVQSGKDKAAETDYGHALKFAGGQASDRLDNTHSTPGRSHRPQAQGNEDVGQRSASRSAQSRRASGQSLQRSSPPPSVRSRADSNRMLTPDETTSSSIQSPAPAPDAPENNLQTLPSDDIGSSPPDISIFAPHDEDDQPMASSRRNSDTPANRQPSVQVDHVPERHMLIVPPLSHPTGPRPALSPVVRIGRTLQNILSDPPSPSARSSVLGSPFKGSVRNSSPLDGAAVDEALQNVIFPENAAQTEASQTATQGAQQAPPSEAANKSWTRSFAPLSQIRNLVSQGAQLFTSPQVNVSQALEDPFGPSSPTAYKRPESSSRGSAFMDRIKQASREGSAHSDRTGEERLASADDEISRAGTSAARASTKGKSPAKSPNSRFVTAQSFQSRLRQNKRFAHGLDGADDEAEDELAGDHMEEEEEEDEDAREDQQQQSSANIPQEEDDAAVEQHEDTVLDEDKQDEDVGQDSRLEEGEMQGDADAMQLDEASADDEDSEEDDIWAIEANRTASSPQAPVPPPVEDFNPRKSGLSVDWRARSTDSWRNSQPGSRTSRGAQPRPGVVHGIRPNDPPEDLEDYSLLDTTGSGTSAQKPAPEPPKLQPKRVDLSDFFSSSPSFMERQRRAKEASLAKAAAAKSTAAQTSANAHVAYPELLPLDSSHRPAAAAAAARLPSPARGISQEEDNNTSRASPHHRLPAPASSSSMTPEKARYPRLPEQEFTPRPPRQHSHNDAALFESWSVSSSKAPPTEIPPHSSDPPPPNDLPIDPIERRSSSSPRPSTPPAVDHSLRPLPDRLASPSKSCLRSPLKPKTPGRVVEFTSSTASAAVAPGKEKNSKNNNNNNNNKHHNPSSSLSAYLSTTKTKPTSPQHSSTSQQSPLSQTHWSIRHWLLLDSLLQSHRRTGPLAFQMRHRAAVMASPAQRPSSALRGKLVTSQGESLVLEQWHLDVVDAFKKELGGGGGGGWSEESLAKRLFALIVGEERRRLGLVPRRR